METEKLHSLVRRYTSPDENPFYSDTLATPLLPTISYPEVIRPNFININAKIMDIYQNEILPKLVKPGNDPTSVCLSQYILSLYY